MKFPYLIRTIRNALVLLSLGLLAPVSQAQWVTDTITLNPGWNSVFLHVEPHSSVMTELISDARIDEMWRWDATVTQAEAALEANQTSAPTARAQQPWQQFLRSGGAQTSFLHANKAYLIKLNGAAAYDWDVKGLPVPPHFHWSVSGLNFVGLPARGNSPVTFDSFFAQSPGRIQAYQIFHYTGNQSGPHAIASDLDTTRTTTVDRNAAYWIRPAGDQSVEKYFGPLLVTVPDERTGLAFGTTRTQHRMRIRNMARTEISVTITSRPSEVEPNGETAITGSTAPTLLIRGALNTTTLTHAVSELRSGGTHVLNLTARDTVGSEVELVLGVDRSTLNAPAGSLFAGYLTLEDTVNEGVNERHVSIRVPFSVIKESSQGLWLGTAIINSVRNNNLIRP